MRKTDLKLQTIEYDGQRTNFLDIPDTCICLYENSNKEVLLIKQYRPIFKDFFIELPGGSNNKNEELELTAKREFKEETGITATNLKLSLSIILSIGSSSERAHIYNVLKVDELSVSKPEDGIEIVWIKHTEIDQMIQNGSIVDAKTIVALNNCL